VDELFVGEEGDFSAPPKLKRLDWLWRLVGREALDPVEREKGLPLPVLLLWMWPMLFRSPEAPVGCDATGMRLGVGKVGREGEFIADANEPAVEGRGAAKLAGSCALKAGDPACEMRSEVRPRGSGRVEGLVLPFVKRDAAGRLLLFLLASVCD